MGEILTALAADVLAGDAELEREPRDAECVHRVRVSVRRLRSLLRTLTPLLDEGWSADLRERLHGISDALSAARDADIAIARVEGALLEIDALARLRAGEILVLLGHERAAAYARIDVMRRSAAHDDVLRALRDAADRPHVREEHGDETFAGAGRPLLHHAYRRLRKRVRQCGSDPSDEALHAGRKAAKHVRYALEAFASDFAPWAERVARHVGRLQDVLGEEHDAGIVASRLRAEGASDAAFAAGELAMVEQRNAAAARSRWRKSWRRVKRCAEEEGKGALAGLA